MNMYLPEPVFAVDGGGGASSTPASPAGPPSAPPPSPSASPSTPASSPSTTTPASTDLPAPTGGLKDAKPEVTDMFANLGNMDDLDNLIDPALLTAAPVAPAPTQPSPTAPEPTTPVPVPPGPTPPAATAATPQPAPAQPAQPSPQVAEPQQQVDIVAELEANKDALIAGLASEQFTLSQEDMQALQTDPNAVIPNMAARVYYMSVVNAARQMKSVLNNLPQMFENYMKVREGNAKAQERFFKRWPKLDASNKEQLDMVARTAMAYRQAQPQLTEDQLFQAVGRVVSAHYKLPLEEVTTAGVVAAPATPPQSVVTTPVPAAFVPAAPGSHTPLPNGQKPAQSEWEGLGADYEG